MTMAVFDYSDIKARMERQEPKPALIENSTSYAFGGYFTTVNINAPCITIAEAIERARHQFYRPMRIFNIG
jgi:hypothetical protein